MRMKKSNAFIWIMAILALIAVYMLGRYFWQFAENGWSNDPMEWGAFGSYMGAITGLLAFVGVLYSVHNANKKSAEAKEEAEKVRKEAAAEDKKIREEAKIESEKLRDEARAKDERDLFFKLVDSHLSSVKTVSYISGNKRHYKKGEEALDEYLLRLNRDLDLLLFWLNVYDCKSVQPLLPFGGLYESMFLDVLRTDSELGKKYFKLRIADVTIKEFYPILVEYVKSILRNKVIYPLYEHYDSDRELRIRQITTNFRNTLSDDEKYAVLTFIGYTLNGELGHGISYHFENIIFITQTINTFLERNRDYYMNYWRSKLSVSEVYVLFFYLLSDRVDNVTRSIFIKYDLLKNNGSRNVFDLNVKDDSTNQLFKDCLQKRINGMPVADLRPIDPV